MHNYNSNIKTYLPITGTFYSTDGATFDSEGGNEEDFIDVITQDRIRDPVIVRGGTNPPERAMVFDRSGISQWLAGHRTDPCTRYNYGPNYQIISVRDRNPQTPYTSEALMQVERERRQEFERMAQYRRDRERVMRESEVRNEELDRRNVFETGMFQEYGIEHREPYRETAVEWRNGVIQRLRQRDVHNELLFRESDPANNAYFAVRIAFPGQNIPDGCQMIEIEFIPENRSLILTIYEYNFARGEWRMTINPGSIYFYTENQLYHSICEDSMMRSLGILAQMRRDMQDSDNYFDM
jgi:hypothetical protein